MIRSYLLGLAMLMTVSVWGQSNSLGDKIGEATFAEVQKSMGIYEDEELLEFIIGIGKRLEAVMPDNNYEFKYYLVDTEDPNAFATAGGYVYVTRGLLAIVDTEDELAGVLGHEFSHVLLKHSEKKLGRMIFPKVLEIPGNLVGSLFSETLGALMNNPIEVSAKAVNAAFDRGQENQADKSGVELAAAAGFDPEALISALEKLEFYVERLTDDENHFHLFDDHPLTEKRVENLNEAIQGLGHGEEYEQKSILPALDGLILGQNPRNGVVNKNNLFLHPDMGFSLQLPTGWNSKNTPASLSAMDSESGSGLVMGLDVEHETAKSAYKDYVKKLKGKGGLMLEVDKKKEINGFRAIELTITDEKKNTTVMTWLEYDSIPGLIHLTGTTGANKMQDVIVASMESFQTITEEERAEVYTNLLRYEETEASTLKAFAEEKGLSDQLLILEIINSISAEDELEKGVVKFVEREPYLP